MALATLALCCGDGAPQAALAGSVALPQDAYPRAAVWNGATLSIERAPLRIVPANASAVDFLVALCEPARVAALPEQALDYASLPDDAEAWGALPRFYAFQAEALLAFEPDLVLADAWQTADTIERLREAGVLVLTLPAVSDWPGARATLEELGRVLARESRATALLAGLDERVAALRVAAAARAPVRALSYSNFGSAGWTAGSGTTLHAQMELAGVTNVVAVAGGEGHLRISFEELLGYDPDCILVSEPLQAPSGHAGDGGGASAALLRGEPALASLRAVREGRIVALPAWFYAASSQRMVAGAEALARAIDALPRVEPATGRLR